MVDDDWELLHSNSQRPSQGGTERHSVPSERPVFNAFCEASFHRTHAAT